MKFDFDKNKNDIIFRERGVSFYQVIEIIAEKGILLNIEHPNKEKYPNQRMFVIEINSYTYCVPYVIDGNRYFLKTIFPNRDFLYLLKEDKNE
jgi:uncharacterized DUF497 family protein